MEVRGLRGVSGSVRGQATDSSCVLEARQSCVQRAAMGCVVVCDAGNAGGGAETCVRAQDCGFWCAT